MDKFNVFEDIIFKNIHFASNSIKKEIKILILFISASFT